MKFIILLLFIIFIYSSKSYGQNTFKALVKDAETKEIIIGAVAQVKGTNIGSVSDENGLIEIFNIPNDKQEIIFRFIDYEDHIDSFVFPLIHPDTFKIFLQPKKSESEDVVISTMRTTRTIQNIPTRVEFIGADELDEKVNMKPGDVRMLLSESTGIQTQQISATSANSSIRIQGMDGRYTQLLKDGYPVYSGFSSGLSIMQIPPLDLQQVEIIKGSASTLYGGGAIAGLINLVTKMPQDTRELSFLINGTTAGGLDISGFYGKKYKNLGLTIFASSNTNAPYDPSKTGLTAIPKFERYTLNPKFIFYISDKTTLNIGINANTENRIGGDIRLINGNTDSTHSYFEKDKSNRGSTQLGFEHKFNDSTRISFKNGISYFDRSITTPFWYFSGSQLSTFSELTFIKQSKKVDWIAGLNVYTDHFKEDKDSSTVKRDYTQNTVGAFLQNTWNATNWFVLETGIREDYVADYGFYTLPRISALFKINSNITSRIGGGLGYKAPTIFTEKAEEIQYKDVQPIDKTTDKVETSAGGSFDINYRTSFLNDKMFFSINQMFFYTKLDNPLILTQNISGTKSIQNANGHIDTRGIETNIKLSYSDLKLYLGYTFTDTKQHFNGIFTDYPLTPKHRVNAILMYEIEKKWRIGLESYYFGPQSLSDGSTGRDYWLCGFMAEKIWKKFSLYINFENILDVRQTRFAPIYTGPITDPSFKEIYAPLDGFVVNGGIKIRL